MFQKWSMSLYAFFADKRFAFWGKLCHHMGVYKQTAFTPQGDLNMATAKKPAGSKKK